MQLIIDDFYSKHLLENMGKQNYAYLHNFLLRAGKVTFLLVATVYMKAKHKHHQYVLEVNYTIQPYVGCSI